MQKIFYLYLRLNEVKLTYQKKGVKTLKRKLTRVINLYNYGYLINKFF